jgi:hypothetical protein
MKDINLGSVTGEPGSSRSVFDSDVSQHNALARLRMLEHSLVPLYFANFADVVVPCSSEHVSKLNI